jgi:small nuclear ribonucleoprotein (snRNP)-like protein
MSEQYHVCRSYLNKRVAVYTTRGERHEGVIVNVYPQNVYLDTSPDKNKDRADTASGKKKVKTKGCGCGFDGYGYDGNGSYGSGFNDTITSLALFDLLAIA